MTGFIQEQSLEIALQCEQLIKQQALREEHAIIALNYCTRMNCSLEQAAKDLGWIGNPRSTFTGRKRTLQEDLAAAAAKQMLEYFE
jgi:hypothetical protein